MRNLIFATVIISASFFSGAYAEKYDSTLTNSRFDQYSPSNLNNPYSQYETQYSPKTLSSPYSVNNQFSVQNTNFANIEEPHDYRTGIKDLGVKAKASKARKESPEEAYLSSLLDKSGTREKGLPLFIPLLLLSSLAIAVTIFVIIGVFKK
ncbi:MAG: hypothetical protein PHR84_00935 [Candidatus Omnitrophica bacterium]|jgi:hypothetical protein|nr:hypothetical protein [Candidatus Omnitrophota bacterium]MDD5660635.1 hypothetical protein [Candidatus Omnitrophota bacterium]